MKQYILLLVLMVMDAGIHAYAYKGKFSKICQHHICVKNIQN